MGPHSEVERQRISVHQGCREVVPDQCPPKLPPVWAVEGLSSPGPAACQEVPEGRCRPGNYRRVPV